MGRENPPKEEKEMLKTAFGATKEEREEAEFLYKSRRISRYSELIRNTSELMAYLPKEDEEGINGLKEVVNLLSDLLVK